MASVTYLSPGVVFVLGGARSGKSAFSEKLAAESGLERHYIATGRAWDSEMEARIAAHRASRGVNWITHEAPLHLAQALALVSKPDRIVLVDCLTLWVTNLMMECEKEDQIDGAFSFLMAGLRRLPGPTIFVSNEVGLGIVPENSMARRFRDHAGRLHQQLAAEAREVFFVAAGLPLRMK
jgi:adenosylcobinamide kinase / adenosylcobinamide-phosphate guanylyltransferase